MARSIRTHFIALGPKNWAAVVDQQSHLIGWIERPEGCYRAGDLLVLQQTFCVDAAARRQCARVIDKVTRGASPNFVLLQLRQLGEALS